MAESARQAIPRKETTEKDLDALMKDFGLEEETWREKKSGGGGSGGGGSKKKKGKGKK
jgi:hypothetical protein